MQLIKTCLRWSYRIFWYSFAGAVILLAIAISLARIFLPDVKVYRTQIEHIASTFLGQEVHIKSMDAHLSGFTPVIVFRDVRMLDDKGKHVIIHFDKAQLGLDLWHSLQARKIIPESFTVYGMNLGINRRKDKTLVLQGLNLKKFENQISPESETVTDESNELARWLFERSLLSLKHSTIVWRDALRGNRSMRFDDVNIDLRNDGDRHQFTGTVSLPSNMGQSLAMALDFKGNILNPQQWQGRFFTRGRMLQIQNWGIKPQVLHTKLEKGVLDVELWGQWQQGKISKLTADVQARNFRLDLEGHQQKFDVKQLGGLIDWQHEAQGWKLNIKNLKYSGKHGQWPLTNMQLAYHTDQDNLPDIVAYTSYLDLADTAQFLQHFVALDSAKLNALQQLSPAGDVRGLYLRYQTRKSESPAFVVSGKFDNLSLHAYQDFPGIQGLSAEVWSNQQYGQAHFADTGLQVNLPDLFRNPLALTRLNGNVHWWHDNNIWYVNAPRLALENQDAQAEVALNLGVPGNEAKAFMDLQAHFAKGDAKHISSYLPVGIMDQELVDWLDRGIVSGQVEQGDVLFHGRLDDFPFRRHNGTFEVAFDSSRATLDYHKGWPRITGGNMHARFTGKGMRIDAKTGKLFDTHLRNIHVSIDNYLLPVLKVRGSFDGEARDAVRFLAESPVAPGAKQFYKQSKITGKQSGSLQLQLPLSRAAEKRHPAYYKGSMQLKHAGLDAWHGGLQLNNLSGRVNFSDRGVDSDKLVGEFSGQPTEFNIFTQHKNAHQIINVSMMGTLDLAKLKTSLPIKGLNKFITGKSPWQGLLRFGSEDDAKQEQVNLHIDTPLHGIALKFPPPLNKPSHTQEDLRVDIRFDRGDDLPLQVALGQRLNATLLLKAGDDEPIHLAKGSVDFSDSKAALPEHAALVVRGRLGDFPVDDWLTALRQLKTDKKMSGLRRFDLPLDLDMDYLSVHTKHDDTPGALEDPKQIALFNADIRELVYNTTPLGHLVLKTSREATGIRFDKIDLTAANMKLTGEGSWFMRNDKPHTNLLLTLNSDNLGALITRLGYKGIIKHGKARVIAQLNWPDSPNQFSLAKLNGSLGAVINDGVITDVEPGAGRLVGLMSLSELPRHLALDFSEFRQGLDFKQIQAQFDILDGDALTRTLHVISSIALIDVTGRTGLAKRDYDLDVSVAPNVSNTLPVISWLAWGGQVGAVTFLMDKLFGKQFNQSIARSYRITGSWEKPEIKEIPSLPPKQKNSQP